MFLGFYTLYSASKRRYLNRLDKLLQNHAKVSKPIGLLLLISPFILLIRAYGFTAGIFIAIISLITISSLVVILAPLLSEKK